MSTVHQGALMYEDLRYENSRPLARTSAGEWWCVFAMSTLNTTFPDTIMAAYSADGLTWNYETVWFTDEHDHQQNPSIAIDSSDNIHVVWDGDLPSLDLGATGSIAYRRRLAGVWEPAELVNDPVGAGNQLSAAIAIDSLDRIHVAWRGTHWGPIDARWQVQYKQKVGGVWQAQEAVTNVAHWQYPPAMAIDSLDNVHLAWSGYGWGLNPGTTNLQYRMRTAAGVWQPQESVNDLPADGGGYPSMVLDGLDEIHLVVRSTNTWHSVRFGGAWPRIAIDVSPNQNHPSVSMGNTGHLHVVWVGRGWGVHPGVDSVQYREYIAGIWQPQVDLINRVDYQDTPKLMWAPYPNIGGVTPNMPGPGYSVIWKADYMDIGGGPPVGGVPHIEFYSTFVAPLPFSSSRAYVLSREEL